MPVLPKPDKSAWVGAPLSANPVTRADATNYVAPSIGGLAMESFSKALNEGLFFSGVASARLDQKLRRIAKDRSTGIERFDENMFGYSDDDLLPKVGETGVVTVEQAEEILKERGISTDAIRFTANKGGPDTADTGVNLEALFEAVKLHEDQQVQDQRIQRGSTGFARGAVAFGAGMAGAMLDPGDVAMSLLPHYKLWQAARGAFRAAKVVPLGSKFTSAIGGMRMGYATAEAMQAAQVAKGMTWGARAVTRAKQGGLDGFVGAAVVEPFVSHQNQRVMRDYGAADSAMNMLFGGVFGAGFHAGLGGIADFSNYIKRGGKRGFNGEAEGTPPYIAAQMAEPIGRLAQNLSELPGDVKYDLFAMGYASLMHGRRNMDMDKAFRLHGLDSQGQRIGSTGKTSRKVALTPQVWRRFGDIMNAVESGKPIDTDYFQLSEGEARAISRAYEGQGGRERFLRSARRDQDYLIARARAADALDGRQRQYESLGEFLARVGDDHGLKKAHDAGYIDRAVGKKQFAAIKEREALGGPRLFKPDDMENIAQGADRMDEIGNQLKQDFSGDLDPQELHAWFSDQNRFENRMDYDPQVIAALDGQTAAQSKLDAMMGDKERVANEMATETSDIESFLRDQGDDLADLDVELKAIDAEIDELMTVARNAPICLGAI